METELSVVIVHYHTPGLLHQCLQSLYLQQDVKMEIIVSDNGSEAGVKEKILEEFSSILWIDNGGNTGFGRANNAGIRKASGKYTLILNSDMKLPPGALRKSLDFHQQKEVSGQTGLTTCRMEDFNGNTLFNSNPEFSLYGKLIKANPVIIKIKKIFGIAGTDTAERLSEKEKYHRTEHSPVWIGAAYVFFQTETFRQEGFYFDEHFFMYHEDVEWCLRIASRGYLHHFDPSHTVYHKDGGSSVPGKWRQGQVLVSEWLLAARIKGKAGLTLYVWLQKFNLWLDAKLAGEEYIKHRTFVLETMRQYLPRIYSSCLPGMKPGKNALRYDTE
jgi:GT2 family glycosyltransferase